MMTGTNSRFDPPRSERRVVTRVLFGQPTREQQVPTDISDANADTTFMTQITREEMQAKLEAIEARMDTRLVQINAQIDAFLVKQAERDKTLEERDKRLDERDLRLTEKVSASITLSEEWNQKFRTLTELAVEAAKESKVAAAEASTVKNNYWAAVGVQILAVAAIIVGAYLTNQSNVTAAISSTMSAFQAGKESVKQETPK